MDVNAYVECMSRPKNVTLMKFLKILSIMLFAGFLILGLLLGGSAGLIAFIIMILSAAGIWFFGLRASVEYEYQYVDRELTVDYDSEDKGYLADISDIAKENGVYTFRIVIRVLKDLKTTGDNEAMIVLGTIKG